MLQFDYFRQQGKARCSVKDCVGIRGVVVGPDTIPDNEHGQAYIFVDAQGRAVSLKSSTCSDVVGGFDFKDCAVVECLSHYSVFEVAVTVKFLLKCSSTFNGSKRTLFPIFK